jgi:KDO2-lipid IV(A) lauroyltransferase
VPFFGRPANAPIGQSLLGLRTGSVFLPMACVRIDSDRYRVIVKPPVEIVRTDDKEKDAENLTAACVRELEKIIDEYKSQWIWLHNRWRTSPKSA